MAVIAVAGGMGQVGRAIVDGLVKHGHKVIVLSRKVCEELLIHFPMSLCDSDFT